MSSFLNIEEKCLICGEMLENSHPYKKHKIKLADYYQKYLDKKDLLTNEPIVFKNRDQYVLSDFNTKTNLKKWLNEQPDNIKREYLKKILLKRKEIKNLVYTPTQVELRSMDGMSGIVTFNSVFGDYYGLCEELGFKSRGFQKLNENTILKNKRTINNIKIDSREQKFLYFNKNIEIRIETLPYGDYTIENNHNIFIERKSIQDFVSSFLPNGFERLRREIQRAKDAGDYIIMLVEMNLSKSLSYEYNTRIPKYSAANSHFTFHNVRLLLQEFDNFQVAFCNGRFDMIEKIIKIFEMEDFWKYHDLQLAIDYKLFDNQI